jgi:hypothetical protein
MLRLVLAVLFRAGSIEVTYQGSRFRNYQDPLSRVPFTNTVAFRTSLFSPRDTLNLKTLTLAVQQLEELTGEEIDVEEGAIASAFKKLASEELEKLYPLKATAEAYQLPLRPRRCQRCTFGSGIGDTRPWLHHSFLSASSSKTRDLMSQ